MWIEPGEQAARARLRWSCRGQSRRMSAAGISRPSTGAPSCPLIYVWDDLRAHRDSCRAEYLSKGGPVSRADVFTWMDELVWREFFQQVLMAFPRVAEGPFKTKPGLPAARAAGPERDRLFAAWCQGRTGYPIVDAGMRQLNQTGWMHNRVRMVVASFLVKDLRIDWQSGEQYFMQHLSTEIWRPTTATGNGAPRPERTRCRGTGFSTRRFKAKSSIAEGEYIRRYVPESPACRRNGFMSRTSCPGGAGPYRCRIGLEYPRHRGSSASPPGILRSRKAEGGHMMSTPLRLGISRCLLGEEVRFDGGHKRDEFLTDVLGRYVEWVPVCPEVEAGLGTPREAMRLVGNPEHPRLITIKSGKDHTEA